MNDELTYFKGTHRVIAPQKTIEINKNKLKTAGITRIADITDLDRIGLPVFTVIRPTAEDGAISVYGGKGISKIHAKASGMMEAFERYVLFIAVNILLIFLVYSLHFFRFLPRSLSSSPGRWDTKR